MRISRLIPCFALGIGLCALAGCNKPADSGKPASAAAQPGAVGTPASKPGTLAGAAGKAAPAKAVPANPAMAGPVTQPAQAAGKGTQSGQVVQPDLTGKWIALFGRDQSKGVIEAWKTGEYLQFGQAGDMTWVQSDGGIPMHFTASLDGSGLNLTPGLDNVGRDDEVGLMNVGRDDEVGLNKSDPSKQKVKQTGAEKILHKKIFRDGNFLALIDSQNNIMVYGKEDPAAASQPPAISGKFLGSIEDQRSVPAQFTASGNTLTASLNNGQGDFKGEYIKGFFVGMSGLSDGQAMAALAPQPDGSLDGVLLQSPYSTMNATFDFVPGT